MNCLIDGMAKIIKKKLEQVTSNEVQSAKAECLKFHGSIKNLLVSHDETIEDKIATVKTAQLVDNGRFEIAFKTLMKK